MIFCSILRSKRQEKTDLPATWPRTKNEYLTHEPRPHIHSDIFKTPGLVPRGGRHTAGLHFIGEINEFASIPIIVATHGAQNKKQNVEAEEVFRGRPSGTSIQSIASTARNYPG